MELVRKKLKRSTFDYVDMGEEEKGHLPCLEGLNGKGWSGDMHIDKKAFNFTSIDSGCGNLKSTHDSDDLQTFEVEPLSKGKEPNRETPEMKVERSSKSKINCHVQEKKVVGDVVEASNCQMGESWTNSHSPSLDLVASIKEMARERMVSTGNESIAGILSWRALRAIGIVAEDFVKDQMESLNPCLPCGDFESYENVQPGSLSIYGKITEEKVKASKQDIPTFLENGNEQALQPKNENRKREDFS